MKHQALRPIAMMLSILLATAAPAMAGTIHFADVMQAVAEGRRGPATDLRLRAIQQQGGKTAPGLVASTQSTTTTTAANGNSANAPNGSTAGNTTTSIISQDPAQQQGGTVETIDLGDVTGTVCDCGEIPVDEVAKRGFPWLPLLGIPLICLTGICTSEDTVPECVSNCGPGPTPTPPGVPEPATLLLFGSGLLALGAGARRRRGIKSLEEATREQEVV